ncbi:MAG: hypothetical protein ACTSVI_03240 [Promethearchaeota archaeon]
MMVKKSPENFSLGFYKGLLFIIQLAAIIIAIRVFSIYKIYFCYNPGNYDAWNVYALEIKQKILDPSYNMFEGIHPFYSLNHYWHSYLILYPLATALLSFIINDINISGSYISGFSTLLIAFYCFKICKEHLRFSNIESIQSAILFLSSYSITHFFYVPLPFILPISLSTMLIYQTLNFFKKPKIRTLFFLSIITTLILFCKEIIWPLLMLPIFYLVFLKIIYFKAKTEFPFHFKKTLLFLITFCILIPGLIFLLFVNSLNLWPAFGIQSSSLLATERSLPSLLYSSFITITVSWIPFAFAFSKDLKYFSKFLKNGELKILNYNYIFSDDKKSENPELKEEKRDVQHQLSFFKNEHEKSSKVNFFIKTKESRHDEYLNGKLEYYIFYIFIIFFYAYKIIIPGSFLGYYMINLIPALTIISLRGLKSSKLMNNKYFFLMIIFINLGLGFLQIFPQNPFIKLNKWCLD